MTKTSMKLMGNQALASFQSKARKEMMPNFLTIATHDTHTIDCIPRRRKFMEKCAPDTTNWTGYEQAGAPEQQWQLTLLTRVMRIDAKQ